MWSLGTYMKNAVSICTDIILFIVGKTQEWNLLYQSIPFKRKLLAVK